MQSKKKEGTESECLERLNDVAYEHSPEEDTSSSDLKWDSMSVTSAQSSSGMARFDTIEDVSHAIGTLF